MAAFLLTLRALMGTLSLAEGRLGDVPGLTSYITDVLATLSSPDTVWFDTTTDDAWLAINRAIDNHPGIRPHFHTAIQVPTF